MFCETIFKTYEAYLTKVSQKNLNERKKLRKEKIMIHNESKIKLKQIQIFKDTRSQEITSLEANIKGCITKQNETLTDFKNSYPIIFSITKILIILFIFMTIAIINKNKIYVLLDKNF